jgi:hypothetical protein
MAALLASLFHKLLQGDFAMTHTTRIRLATAATLVLLLVSTANGAEAQTIKKCRAADQTTASIIAQLKQWVSTKNPERMAQRDTIFHIPVVDPKTITLVTDETMCGKVITAYSKLSGGGAYTPARLYVFKHGSKGFVGYDPDRGIGEYGSVIIFNTKFVRIGGWAG